ncbi:DUF1062 domain-containing protein [Mesorhizobium sp. LNHC221B00]|uniref:DUF1062 domain-containing protein n=1 Tax=Mesorhizobium sp. LNHC221B00 TaxID=1287233 RepID=UPI0032AFDE01
MALLNRLRAFRQRHLTPRSPQPTATPRPHGHLEIADLMNFPTGRAYRHVRHCAYPLGDRASNRSSTPGQLQSLRRREGVSLQRKVPRQRQRQAHRRVADLSLRRLRQFLELRHSRTLNRRDIEPALLQALESNDPGLARRHAFNVSALRNQVGRVEEFPDVAVQRHLVGETSESATALELRLGLEMPISLRLDRLLANELGISRSRLQAFEERRLLAVRPDGAKALRRAAREGTIVLIDLEGEPDREAIISAAGG